MQEPTKQYSCTKSLRIIYIALLAGQIIFFAIIIALHAGNFISNNTDLVPVMNYAVPAVLLFTILFSSGNYRKKLPKAVVIQGLTEKLEQYRKLCIIRYAFIEGGTIFSIIAYFLTGHSLTLACSIAGIVMFASLRPTKEKIIQELELSSEEAKMLD